MPANDPTSSPRERHAVRRADLERERERLAKTSGLISNTRLVTFLGAFAIACARGFGYLTPTFTWIGVLLGTLFILLVIWHARLDGAERRVRAAVEYHRWAIDRIDGRFDAYPSRGDRFVSDDHPYTTDLGIFGPSSMFQLLDCTHTRRGEEYLARWLAEPSPASAVVERQRAVRDLVTRESLREELAVLGGLIAADKPNPDPLVAWAEQDATHDLPASTRALSFALPVATAASFALGQVGTIAPQVWYAALALQWIYALALLAKIEPVAGAVSSREGALARYRSMLELVENERFEAARLEILQRDLGGRGASVRASTEVRRLSRIVGFLDARQNEAFRFFIGPLVLWDAHCVLALQTWRKRAGKNVGRWLEVIGEVEALASLGAFAADHPENAWPTLSEVPSFRAKGLGHPLIERNALVKNDVELREPGTALLVTGSNMSGKSTLLRSMGINAVLATAGAPVAADSLVTSVFEVRTSMWARDSLAKGVSHFYAELQKLKRVVDGIRAERPLFFLLDEILQGTNSRERVIGARSVLRHLLSRGAMGAVSTHDTGLLDLPPELDARLDKVHFEEQVGETASSGAEMSFDHRLRPGVVRSTNALRLMKLVGIDVEIE